MDDYYADQAYRIDVPLPNVIGTITTDTTGLRVDYAHGIGCLIDGEHRRIELQDQRVDDLTKRIDELEKDRKDRDRVIELLYETICESEKNGAKHSYPEELRHLLFDMT